MPRKKSIGAIIIVLGIAILLFPWIKNNYYKWEQKKLLSQIKLLNTNYDDKNRVILEADIDRYKLVEEQMEIEETSSTVPMKNNIIDKAMGIITISSIDLELPVFNGVYDDYLNIGPCKLEGTASFGDEGNLVIAGHRNYTYGQQFNRLNELKKGDKIRIEDRESNQYVYKVESQFIVMPEEVWVTESQSNKKIITLITCHPIDTGEKRLIIQGILEE